MPRASLQSQQDRRALPAFGMKQEVLPPKKIPARCGPWSHLRGCPNSPRAPTRRDDWTETSSLEEKGKEEDNLRCHPECDMTHLFRGLAHISQS